MKCLALVVILPVVIALTGCVDNRKMIALKEKVAYLDNQNDIFNARIKALENACLELNTRITTAAQERAPVQEATFKQNTSQPEGRATDQEATAQQSTSQPDKDLVTLISSKPDLGRPTRASFSRFAVGMTITEMLSKLGKPDNISEVDGSKQWVYNRVVLDIEGGGVESSPALIVFENGCVLRASLTKLVDDASKPPKN